MFSYLIIIALFLASCTKVFCDAFPLRDTVLQPVSAIALSPEGGRVAIAKGKEVAVWYVNILRQSPDLLLKYTGDITALVFDPLGKNLFVATRDGNFFEYDLLVGKDIWQVTYKDYVQRIIVGYKRAIIIQFKVSPLSVLNQGAETTALSFEGAPRALSAIALRPDDRFIALASGPKIGFWDVETRKLEKEVSIEDTDGGYITSIAWSSDGQFLLAGSTSGRVYMWQVFGEDPNLPRSIIHGNRISAAAVSHVAFSPDTITMAAGTDDGHVYVWHKDDQSVINYAFQDSKSVRAIAFNANGEMLAAGSQNGEIMLWNAKTGAELCGIDVFHPVQKILFDPQGRYFVVQCFGPTAHMLFLNENKTAVKESIVLDPQAKKIENVAIRQQRPVVLEEQTASIQPEVRTGWFSWIYQLGRQLYEKMKSFGEVKIQKDQASVASK